MDRSPRQEQIIQQLRLRGSLRVAELAAQFGVSRETIRRDVAPLARTGDREAGPVSVSMHPSRPIALQ